MRALHKERAAIAIGESDPRHFSPGSRDALPSNKAVLVANCVTRDGSRKKAPFRSVNFGDLARAVRDIDHGRLSGTERAFLAEMLKLGFDRMPSPRQRAWLTEIFARLLQGAA